MANPTQDDTLGNGVGDACRLFANITAPSGDTTLIAGEGLAFAAATSGTPAVAPLSVQWSFAGAAPDSSELSPGTVLFNDPGTHTVTLTGLDGNGVPVSSESRSITVLGSKVSIAPTAPSGVIEGTPVILAATVTSTAGQILESGWDTGDGSALAGASVEHTYVSNGTFNARVSATDINGFRAETTVPVVVANSAPAVVLNADVLTGTAPLTVKVTDDSTAWDGIASRLWSLNGAPNSDTAITVGYTFDAPGTYTLALEVTDNDGSVSSDTVEITVTGVAEATVPMLPPAVMLALVGLVSVLGARANRRRV